MGQLIFIDSLMLRHQGESQAWYEAQTWYDPTKHTYVDVTYTFPADWEKYKYWYYAETPTFFQADRTVIEIAETEPSGNAAGNSIAGIKDRDLNTPQYIGIPNTSKSGQVITIPPGTYRIFASASAYRSGIVRLLITDDSNNILCGGVPQESGNTESRQIEITLRCIKKFDTEQTIKLRQYSELARLYGFGVSSGAGIDEVYAYLRIEKIS